MQRSPDAPKPLASQKCPGCREDVSKLGPEEVNRLLSSLPGWTLVQDNTRIRKEWVVKDFAAGMDFLSNVGKLADEEGHHPEVHLTGYRRVMIELWTHKSSGLTINDLILAAKIDQLPIKLKASSSSTA